MAALLGRADERDHFVAAADQLLDDLAADESGGASDEILRHSLAQQLTLRRSTQFGPCDARTNIVQTVDQIRDQIVGMLDAGREPNQRVRQSERGAALGGNRCVRHARRMTDQRLHAAETLAEREEPSVRHKRVTSSTLPSSSNDTMPPNPAICCLAMSWPG